MNAETSLERPGQVMECSVEQLRAEARLVVYAVVVEEHEEHGKSSVERLEVPGSFLHAVLRVLLVPGISLEHGLRPRRLDILAIAPIGHVGCCVEKRLGLDGGS